MQTIVTGSLTLLFSVVFFIAGAAPHSASTCSELEVIRHYQTDSVDHVAPAAHRLHQKFVLWLS